MEQQSKGHAFSKITARNEATCSSRDSLRRKCCWVRNTSAVGDGDGWINMDPSYNGRHSRLRRTQPGSNASLDSYSQGVLPAAGPCCHVCQVGRTCLAALIRRSPRTCEPFFSFSCSFIHTNSASFLTGTPFVVLQRPTKLNSLQGLSDTSLISRIVTVLNDHPCSASRCPHLLDYGE